MKKKKTIFAVFITLLILFSLLLSTTFISWFFRGEPYLLYPKSPDNIQLMSRTYFSLDLCPTSRIFIIYSVFNIKKTDITFDDNNGPGIYGTNADYIIEWIDDSHVSISFKGHEYKEYETQIIEY